MLVMTPGSISTLWRWRSNHRAKKPLSLLTMSKLQEGKILVERRRTTLKFFSICKMLRTEKDSSSKTWKAGNYIVTISKRNMAMSCKNNRSNLSSHQSNNSILLVENLIAVFLFLKIKMTIKDPRFHDMEEIEHLRGF